MAWHYDLRLVCPLSGQLEATESIGLTAAQAEREILWQQENPGRREYRIVSCDEPGSSRVHDVDLAFHVHHAVHEGLTDWEYCGYIGAPTDDWIETDTASPR